MDKVYELNGERLKSARIYRGLTVAELASQIGCRRQTVSMYENGQIRNPDKKQMGKIVSKLGFPSAFFYEKSKRINTGSTYFRALLTTNKKYRSEQIQKMEFVAEIYNMLDEYIEFSPLSLPTGENNASPEEEANALRKKWKLGTSPIENIIFTAERHGLIVTSFETSTDSIDAFSQQIDVQGEAVFVIGYSNNKTSAARIHFDIAHELGHICLHEWSEDIETLEKDEFKKREKEASEFASAFLLPADEFRLDLQRSAYSPVKLDCYKQLKKKWKVSMAAMIRRAWTLDIIEYSDYQMLMRKMQRKGMRKDEPLDDTLTTAKPASLKQAIIMLLEEKVFTPKQFMDELSFGFGFSVYPSEIEYLLDLPKNTLDISNIIPIHSFTVKDSKQ